MNIICKLFGHSMYYKGMNIAGKGYCGRKGCDHTSPAIVWPKLPMPKCKPPRDATQQELDLQLAKAVRHSIKACTMTDGHKISMFDIIKEYAEDKGE